MESMEQLKLAFIGCGGIARAHWKGIQEHAPQIVVTAAESSGCVFMVAEQSAYWPEAVAVQQLIQDGGLGDIITARAFFGG